MNSPPIILSRPHRPQHSPTRHPIRKLSRMRHNPRTHSQSRIRRQPIKTNPNINNLLPPQPLQRKRERRPPQPVNIRIPHLHTRIRSPLTIRFKPPRRDISQINRRINPHRKHPTRIIQPPPIHPHTQQPPITSRHHRHHRISLHIRPRTIPPRRIKYHRPRHHKRCHPRSILETNRTPLLNPRHQPRRSHPPRPLHPTRCPRCFRYLKKLIPPHLSHIKHKICIRKHPPAQHPAPPTPQRPPPQHTSGPRHTKPNPKPAHRHAQKPHVISTISKHRRQRMIHNPTAPTQQPPRHNHRRDRTPHPSPQHVQHPTRRHLHQTRTIPPPPHPRICRPRHHPPPPLIEPLTSPHQPPPPSPQQQAPPHQHPHDPRNPQQTHQKHPPAPHTPQPTHTPTPHQANPSKPPRTATQHDQKAQQLLTPLKETTHKTLAIPTPHVKQQTKIPQNRSWGWWESGWMSAG